MVIQSQAKQALTSLSFQLIACSRRFRQAVARSGEHCLHYLNVRYSLHTLPARNHGVKHKQFLQEMCYLCSS